MSPHAPVGRVRRLLHGFAAIALLASFTVLLPAPAYAVQSTVDHVVIVGVSGLRWDDITEQQTPHLFKLANKGAVGSLSVRAATSLTCPVDGWTTLSAGNRAQGPLHSRSVCVDELPIQEPVPTANGSHRLAEQSEIRHINDKQRFGAKPGTLASSVKCVSAVGLPAAAGAARTSGQVDNYQTQLPADASEFLARCPVTMLDVGEVRGPQRKNDLPGIDASIGKILASTPPRTMTMVVGVSDVSSPSQLHVAIVDGPGFEGRWLTSASTRRQPFVQLVDVLPTVLKSLDVGIPNSVVGQAMTPGATRERSTESAIRMLWDHNKAAQASRPLTQNAYTVIVTINLALLVTAAIFFRRRQREVGETLPDPAAGHTGAPHLLTSDKQRRFARRLELGALWVAALPVASFAANITPWYKWPAGWVIYLLSILLISMAIVAVASVGPWARHSLGPPAVVASITGLVLGVDVLTGSYLQFNALVGYSPIVAGRFTGFGNIPFALFATGALIGAAYASQIFDRWRRAVFLAAIGTAAVIIVGAPMWGSDVGGIIALTPAFIVTTMRAVGLWLTPVRVLGSMLGGLIVVTVFALVDYARPEDERTHLGRFVAQLMDGTATTVLHRKAEANLNLLISSQLTLLVMSAIVFVPLVLMRRSAGLWRVFGLHPTVRAGALGVLVAAVLGFALNDSGIAVPAFVAALVVPLLIVTILRVLAEATRGTVVPGGPHTLLASTLPPTVGHEPAVPHEAGLEPGLGQEAEPVAESTLESGGDPNTELDQEPSVPAGSAESAGPQAETSTKPKSADGRMEDDLARHQGQT